MVNLLPEESRENAAIEFRFRLAIVLCAGIGSVFLAGAGLLFPAYLSAEIKHSAIVADQKQNVAAKNERELADAERAAIALFPQVATVARSPRPSLYIQKITEVPRKGVQIQSIQFQSLQNPKFVISGSADTRDALIAYKENVASLKGVTVNLPISDLVRPTDLTFTMTLVFTGGLATSTASSTTASSTPKN